MPGNTEEKEKCLEKLNQMQKYLPFLDFMIDKIKKKNNEISLECQLSKFQLLRSMIAEKNGKCTWNVVVKVEDVIQKLISKLDFKDPNEKSKQPSTKTVGNYKTSATTSIVPSTTSSRTTRVDSKQSSNAVMNTLKTSVDSQKEVLSNTLGSARPIDSLQETMETDLDKDLDGFDLTDYPGLSGSETKNPDSVQGAVENPPNHDDLLSSSREKLMKSLQSRLFPSGIPAPSCGFGKNEKRSSAFNRSQINTAEQKGKSDVSENSENSAVDKNNRKDSSVKSTENKDLVTLKSLKTGNMPEKSRTESVIPTGEVNLKQKLKEKLSTDISEVYRVPGKSIGGSLRCLKESKDRRKSNNSEEEELLKPDKPQRIRISTEKKDVPHRDTTQSEKKEKKGDHSSKKKESKGSKKSDDKNTKKQKSESKSLKDWKKSNEKFFELSKVNDEELLAFVKDNVQSFPHLAKMKLPELKQAVQSSLIYKLVGLDPDTISEISDGSLEDLDIVENDNSKSDKGENKEVKSTDTNIEKESGVSDYDDLNDEDYALKLLEDTTLKTYPPKKKKGLLELPMPITDDLFDDISSIESFESFRSPLESKDQKVKKLLDMKKPNENKPELNQICKTVKEVPTSSRTDPQPIPKDTSQNSKPQMDKKVQEKPSKQEQCAVESIGAPLWNANIKPLNNDGRRHSSSEAKSYAEYKRRKLKEKEKVQKESCKSDALNASDVSQLVPEKEDARGNNAQVSRRRNSEISLKTYNLIHTERYKKISEQSRRKSREEVKERKSHQEEVKKSGEPDELVSPLEELYKYQSKPKTGRGYGIQHFKIPKKVVVHQYKKKTESNKKEATNPIKEVEESEKVNQVPLVESTKAEETKISDVDSTKNEEKVEFSESTQSTDKIEPEPENSSVADSSENCINTKDTLETNPEPESANVLADTNTPPEVDSSKTEKPDTSKSIADSEESVISVKESKTIAETMKRVEPQIVECDSSMETSSPSEHISEKDSGDKSMVVAKEEITQEFVESLIRKSFQSGEGKLLLAQVKLFEKFAKKLNSKKLKTIQKIINSESDSSSSPSETTSDDEKKKKKGKKSEEKNRSKKRRKKGKNRKKKKSSSSSSSSSSESEENSEEESYDKKEGKSDNKKNDISVTTSTTSEESKAISDKPSEGLKVKRKKVRRNPEFGRNFSKRKAKRKQQQKKMLEQILNEEPQPEAGNDSNTETPPAKESEQKRKNKTKAKGKTELDRLHEDIRSMFISEGVVTATGQRMCRILKQSGGNMNNLDIVKESAKMVEEEKLKVQPRTSLRNSRASNTRSSESRSRSQSLDKGKSQQENEEDDLKLAFDPRVILQRVNLDNIGYGIKISDDCVSFRRLKGRNTALKRTKMKSEGSPNDFLNSLARNVFLTRNMRKFERMRDSNKKKCFKGKKLMEVVKNLPLKMAKMKHLQIGEAGDTERMEKEKNEAGETIANKTKLSDSELLQYAFNKKRDIYSCMLCTSVTRNITGHYRTTHPESEVLISRLTIQEAKRAKLDAERNYYNDPKGEQRSLATSIKRKMKTLGGRFCYNCRMCHTQSMTDINSFASHVSTHTGELRYKCPSDGCTICRPSFEDIKFHILTKHPKYRKELNNKIMELYSLTVEDGKVFGFLCSKCNFIQIRRENLETHISNKHKDYENAKIIKINLSGNKLGPGNKRKLKLGLLKEGYKKEKSSVDIAKPLPAQTKERRKRKRKSVDKLEADVEPPEKKIVVSETGEVVKSETADTVESETTGVAKSETTVVAKSEKADVVEAEDKSEDDSQDGIDDEEVDMEENDSMEDDLPNVLEVDDCVDLKRISELKGSDIIKSMEPQRTSFEVERKVKNGGEKLKVGPLEAQLLDNSEVLYECYVKGCLFSTKIYDLFQKHIKISHWRIKWGGNCDLCKNKKKFKSREGHFQLLTALKHLKFHEWERLNESGTPPTELKPPPDLSEDGNLYDDDSEKSENFKHKTDGEEEENETSNNFEDASYPVKPLLRVRNFQGDRLSTPKAEENPVETTEDKPTLPEPATNSTKMFTIENVRSLTEPPQPEGGLKIEQVCSLKEQITQSGAAEKAIIVRSCPTRTIPIRPKPSTLPVDVGHVPRPPSVSHSLVLSPISTHSPIQIVSKVSKAKFTVKPVVVSNEPALRSLIPVINSGMSPTVLPVIETNNVPQEGGKKMGRGERIKSPSKSPSRSSPHQNPDQEETDCEDGVSPHRIPSDPRMGKKSVKDSKIYQEMLTKTKLCHLFKCMGIECSFTCNNENVFTQHIGLHEAQRRLGRSKAIKMFRMANKSAAFHWQQCAYCCDLLNNSNNALGRHIFEEHGHCMYQCAFCFYRAISHNYVEIHQNLAHTQILKTTPRLIYKCKPLKIPPTKAAALEKHGRRQSVRPYHCDQCGRNFYITQEFTTHLAKEHQSVTAYTCHICKNLCFKVNRLINHYKLHSYSMYQCAYCLHGTESEKEMVFHLSNFHFSQPALMYMRALAEGQIDDEKEKPVRRKKLSNQLESLKVITYKSDTSCADCIVEVDQEDEMENSSNSPADLSSIVAELGINTDVESSSSSGVTPFMQELASMNDKTAKNLTVKTLLPNASFSSENESGIEKCSVLISSGLSVPSNQNDEEKELSIPLGQLPLEAVNVQHKEANPTETVPTVVSSSDKSTKLNEIFVNRYCKTLASVEEDKIPPPSTVILSTAVHKLPPVVLTRSSALKSSYPSKCCTTLRKKSEDQVRSNEEDESENKETGNNQTESKNSCEKDTESEDGKVEPVITNVVSFSNTVPESPILISKICSLSDTTPKEGVTISVKPKTSSTSILKPPIIRVEDFPIDDKTTPTVDKPVEKTTDIAKIEKKEEEKEEEEKEKEKEKEKEPASPEVIILEDQKAKDILMVTIDSDEEKDESLKKDPKEKIETGKQFLEDNSIRKEMELLRKQIVNETDSLLNDETEVEKPALKLSLDLGKSDQVEEPKEPSLLSPIEEAICSLNKKLQSETEEAQKKEDDEEEEKMEETPKKMEECENRLIKRPRTRFGARKDGESSETTMKVESKKKFREDSTGKITEETMGKKFKEELVGKELFICGNEKCDYAADNDYTLKDHLYVCDLSRESSVLVCPHCSRQIKQFHPYLEHLRYHGEKKFHCGLCSFSSAVDTSTSRHVKQKHKCSLVKILPMETKGHLIYYPKNYKIDKIDFEANGYSPGDEDKLPLQSVYQVNVKCAKCPYFTKVRSNMVRHLKIHVKSVETEGVVVVPSTAPTNPVPCLETKERMFDKMTNLAASSQLAQAKEKTFEGLTPEEEAKLPQFVPEQMRYKCCLPDCNYITVDDGMLKHHIKALHTEINYYSCPHCKETVHADVRNVVLDKIGHHLKYHDTKLFKCAHCIYFHCQKSVVEKHTLEKHPDRRYYVHTVREPKPEFPPESETSISNDGGTAVLKCELCDDFKTPSKPILMDHLLKSHNARSKYKCQFCAFKGNSYQVVANHFATKHPGEKISYAMVYHTEKVGDSGNSSGADSSNEYFDTTPLWQRGASRIRHIRGILIEEEKVKKKKKKRVTADENETESSETTQVKENAFYCPLCTNKKKPFYTRNEDCFRTHLYQELNYQQYACILCGKMFVDRKDFEKHHGKVHADKIPSFKQTKEDNEIKFWVDQVIAKRKKQMEERKRKLSETELNEFQGPAKKKKESLT